MTVSPWTASLIAELPILWKENSAREISVILNEKHGTNFTRSSVIAKLHRLGLTSNSKTKCHPSDTYAPKRIRDLNPKPVVRKPAQRKPKLRIVANGGGGFRFHETVVGNLPELRCVELPPLGLSFEQINDDTCKYIAGDALAEGGALYCGHPVFKRSLCAQHFLLCYDQPTPHKPKYMVRRAA